MGVCNLWNLLEPAKKSASLKELSGKTVAIDLAGWVVQSHKASQPTSVSGTYLMIRVLFYRLMNLLKHGIKPVFVSDGRAPEIKSQTMTKRQENDSNSPNKSTERKKFHSIQEECIKLLEALGIPCLQSSGEAEKLCALLNSSELVDAVMTDDGDCLLYGATNVYRHYEYSKKETTVFVYEMSDIEDKLNLTRRDLVAYALLAGCDYNDTGIHGMGQSKSYAFIQELKKLHADVLDRMLNWRNDEELKIMKETRHQLNEMKKERHCSTCSHIGSVKGHLNTGCMTCETKEGCKKDCTACSCSWHVLHDMMAPFNAELRILAKTESDKNFPDNKLVDEFLGNKEDITTLGKHMVWNVPEWRNLIIVVQQHLRLSEKELYKAVFPVMVYMTLYGTLPPSTIKLVKILRSCRQNLIQCHEVEWCIMGSDWPEMSKEDRTVKTDTSLLNAQYEHLVKDFEKQKDSSKKKSGKQKMTPEKDSDQTTVNMFLPAKRRLNFDGKIKTKPASS